MDSLFSVEKKVDSLISVMQTQVNRANNSAINDKVIPHLLSKLGRLPLREYTFGTGRKTIYVNLSSGSLLPSRLVSSKYNKEGLQVFRWRYRRHIRDPNAA